MKEVNVTLKVFDYTEVVETRKYISKEVFCGSSEENVMDKRRTLKQIDFMSDSDTSPFCVYLDDGDSVDHFSFIAIRDAELKWKKLIWNLNY